MTPTRLFPGGPALALLALVGLAAPALAAKAPSRTTPGPIPSSAAAARAGLPQWTPPPAYSEQLVYETDGKTIVMDRKVDHGKLRTDMAVDGMKMTMIETGDEKGTSYMVMPDQKRAMKQSRQAMEGMAKSPLPPDSTAQGAADYQVEDLGEETIDGVVTKKLRLVSADGDALTWFDKASGAPVRMESKAEGKAVVLSWKNRKVEPQPEALFTVPKEYEVMDMDEMRSKMGGMGGMAGMGGAGALGGLMGKGKAGGMAGGMAGGLAGGMGSNLGGGLGGMLGGSIGGPLGSIAGRYIGGKIGGALGHKAASAIVH
jgi:outer membrane lipoprotein-sorting protein